LKPARNIWAFEVLFQNLRTIRVERLHSRQILVTDDLDGLSKTIHFKTKTFNAPRKVAISQSSDGVSVVFRNRFRHRERSPFSR
jgi:hypothetical protein